MNKSADISWLSRDIKRFKEIGTLIPALQRRIYEKISEEWCSGRTVVDLGCSIGIGSNILSHWARWVWGLDINKEAVKFGQLAFGRPNLEFAIFDIENPPTRKLATFEVIVASEIIEHLEKPEMLLNLVKRFFNPKGGSMAFITVPNINNEEIKKRDAENKLHFNRWTAGEFYNLMTTHFQAVVMYSAEKLDKWEDLEMVDGNTKEPLIVCKVEGIK